MIQKAEILDNNGNHVYGKLTYNSAVYTLSFYSLVSGTETPYSFGTTTTIDFNFLYLFDFARIPTRFAVAVRQHWN
jgi:hypothetical protein